MKKWHKVALFLMGLWLLVVWLGYQVEPGPRRAFAKYIYSPVPATVDNLVVDVRDMFGIEPEPVCYFSFTIGKEDLETIVTRGKFNKVEAGEMFIPNGPVWFRPDLISTNAGRFYFRRGRRLAQEFLWIHPSGTNAYFLLWGI